MTLFGQGRAALADDAATAVRLGWGVRRRSAVDPEIILRPVEGDPRREPWIAPPGCRTRGKGARRAGAAPAGNEWSFLPSPPGVLRYLERLAAPAQQGGRRVAIVGLGRVGGIAATVLAATPARRSGIAELLVFDADEANLHRWLLELGSIAAWRGRDELPPVRATTPERVFRDADIVVFAATAGVPPLGVTGDVRLVQLDPNREILRKLLERASEAAFTGIFCMVSDPVDWLAQAAFFDSNLDGERRFAGNGLAPERIVGLGLGVMWARALAEARRQGWGEVVGKHGAAFGPHSVEVIAFDDVRAPDPQRSARLTQAARECNYLVRDLGFLPFVGPGVSSVALALPPLLAGREALGSVLVDGLYFGTAVRLRWGLFPVRRRVAPAVSEALAELHGKLRRQAASLGLALIP